MKQYVPPIQCAAVHTHALPYKKKERRHIWTLANRNRPCVCVVSPHWNISLRDQIGFDPALRASESYGSSKCILSLVHTHTCTHTTARAKSSWRYIKVPTETHSELVMLLGVQREKFFILSGQWWKVQWSLISLDAAHVGRMLFNVVWFWLYVEPLICSLFYNK